MDKDAQKILDVLPEDGSKLSGGQIRDQLDLTRPQFDAAKTYLRDHGLATMGRGRGGTVARVVGAEIPTEPKKLSKAEIMANARAEKEARSRAQKFYDSIREAGEKKAKELFPDNKTEVWVVNPDQEIYHIWVWEEDTAKIYKGFAYE